MELASYHDDKPLLQECALRLGNVVAPLLTVSTKSPMLISVGPDHSLPNCLLLVFR
jgi:hypothetical protein